MLYDYQCNTCGSKATAINSVSERRSNAPECCGEKMGIYIGSAPMAYMGRTIDYVCPVTGQHVSSKRQRREIMAREGLVSAHELISSREHRQAKVDESKAIVERGFGPQELKKQVTGWAEKQLA